MDLFIHERSRLWTMGGGHAYIGCKRFFNCALRIYTLIHFNIESDPLRIWRTPLDRQTPFISQVPEMDFES